MLKQGATRKTQTRVGGIREVARAANVSTATVSRVFNRPESVKTERRNRVIEAANRLFYVPDNSARALSSQSKLRIGALIPTIDDSIFARFATSLQSELSVGGYRLILGMYDFDAEQEVVEARSLIEMGIDAMVLCGENRNQELYDILRAHAIPYILTNVYSPSSPHPSVGYDNFKGAAKAARYLVEQGHKQFGVIDFPPDLNDRASMRVEGVETTLLEYGINLKPECRIFRKYSYEDGRIALRTLMGYAPETTAVICGNDVLAIGAMFEASEMGLEIPKDISITGFDGLDLGAQIAPGLTTVDVPTVEMGRRTAETLLATLAGTPAPHATQVTTNLIIRGSTGPAP